MPHSHQRKTQRESVHYESPKTKPLRYDCGHKENSRWVLRVSCGIWCTLHDTSKTGARYAYGILRYAPATVMDGDSTIDKAWTPRRGRYLLMSTLPKCDMKLHPTLTLGSSNTAYTQSPNRDLQTATQERRGRYSDITSKSPKTKNSTTMLASQWGRIKEGQRQPEHVVETLDKRGGKGGCIVRGRNAKVLTPPICVY